MEIVIRSLASDEDAAAFRQLNEEWIAAHFELEDEDRRQLADPVATYITPGGQILLAEFDGAVGGCVAIVPNGSGAYELSKMAVAPALRGRGAGRALVRAAIDHARAAGATSLYLGSSTELPDAVHLYESHGFQHVPRESLDLPFTRASVFMALHLAPGGYEPDPRVDAYIDGLPEWQRAVCQEVRELVHAADSRIEETIKRTVQPYFVLEGNVCALLGTRDHVNVFLYDGAIVPDPDGIITAGHDNKTARTMAVYEGQPVNADAFTAMIARIAANNRAGGWRKLKRDASG